MTRGPRVPRFGGHRSRGVVLLPSARARRGGWDAAHAVRRGGSESGRRGYSVDPLVVGVDGTSTARGPGRRPLLVPERRRRDAPSPVVGVPRSPGAPPGALGLDPERVLLVVVRVRLIVRARVGRVQRVARGDPGRWGRPGHALLQHTPLAVVAVRRLEEPLLVRGDCAIGRAGALPAAAVAVAVAGRHVGADPA